MRLDFNVLWVEDQQSLVQSQKTSVEQRLRKHGFRLRVEFATTVDEATALLTNEIYGDHIDLILMDYNLGPGKQGDQGLYEIRQQFPYKDIIFYSAGGIAGLTEKMMSFGVQGVFLSDRESLPDQVEGVFGNLVHKVLDIDHSRGIVMGATSDIDEMINRAMYALFAECDDTQRAQTMSEFKKHLEKKREGFEKAMLLLDKVSDVSDLEAHHRTYTSDDRLKLLRKLLEITNRHTEHLKQFEEYQSNVPKARNDLAHISVLKTGFARKVYSREGIEITSEGMRQLRISLLDFQDLLIQLFGPTVDLEADE